ncbi:hypothetical protein CERZMDRAFT_62749 [Cercospora zeae-maydis SCOH1-5]|uniref:Uncharacterized protein n=1 Tax=Cercospora zeae-maydis SCOH1-5 TaxID=717836 RepID=A0A6A6EYX9_9PEZI|nr:hypothetical protein CERZMDRAFT_62749 [Cercospora zeae-maydis SCOH1-5]
MSEKMVHMRRENHTGLLTCARQTEQSRREHGSKRRLRNSQLGKSCRYRNGDHGLHSSLAPHSRALSEEQRTTSEPSLQAWEGRTVEKRC